MIREEKDTHINDENFWTDSHVVLFFNWDSLHARLNSHYKASSYKDKKKSTKKITGY